MPRPTGNSESHALRDRAQTIRPRMDDQAAHPVGSDEWLARVFEARVRGGLFGSHVPHPEGPVLVLLGGQPAAGKTQAQHTVLAEHPGDDSVGSPAAACACSTPTTQRVHATMRS